jgi:hypothetical protein
MHTPDYTTVLSVLPREVVCSIVPIKKLWESSDEDEDITQLGRDMQVNISEAFGINLEEVQAQYFVNSDFSDELVEEWNYGDVIENHYWSGRYETEDIDGIPFATYNSDD